MKRISESIRVLLSYPTIALCFATTLLMAACAIRIPAPDFPVFKLANSSEPEQTKK